MLIFLRRNLVWMVLAVILSTTLWTVVTTQQNPDVVDVFQAIPVELRNVPDKLSVRNEVPTVNLEVSAPRDVWPELRPAKLQASVDLSRVGPGLQELPIQVHSIDQRVKIQDVRPGKAIIRLEPIGNKDVPVRPRVEGEVPLGYLARAPKVTPEQISVTGPQSAVDQVVAVRTDVSLVGVTSSISQVYKVVPQNAAGERVERVTIAPENVLIEIPIEHERAFKTVPVTVQLRGAAAPGYQVTGLRVEPLSITVEGEPRDVEALQFASAQPLDLNGASGDLSVNAELQLPSGIRLARAQPVVARIFVQPIESSKIIEVAPTILNVGAGQRAAVVPGSIRLTLVGPMPVLSGTGPRDVRATIDAAGFGEGNHRLRPRLELPAQVRLQQADPEQVELRLNLIP